jgi:hypothetical protein
VRVAASTTTITIPGGSFQCLQAKSSQPPTIDSYGQKAAAGGGRGTRGSFGDGGGGRPIAVVSEWVLQELVTGDGRSGGRQRLEAATNSAHDPPMLLDPESQLIYKWGKVGV